MTQSEYDTQIKVGEVRRVEATLSICPEKDELWVGYDEDSQHCEED